MEKSIFENGILYQGDALSVAPEEGVVLDPFVGGGTTAIACLKTGRRFIGVELSREYFELAATRIREEISAKK